MKKTSYYFLILLNLLSFTLLGVDQRENISITVLDEQKNPIAGVCVIQYPSNYLLGSTDENGMAEILKNKQITGNEQIVLQCTGFYCDTIPWKKINTSTVIILKEKVIQLSESTINVVSLTKLLPQIFKELSRKYKAKNNLCRYYGNGIYSKTVEYNEKTVQLRHEYGVFLTSGNCFQKDKWDLSYHLKFIPIFSARSFDLNDHGTDTLKYKSIIGMSHRPDMEYDVTNQKIYKLMRSAYLYAPLFSSPDYFNFKLTGIDSSYYTVLFSTKPECFPKKAKVFARGSLQINRQTLQLQYINFDYFDYYLYSLVNNQPEKAPFVTKARISFVYDQDNHAYISDCECETYWKYSPNVQSRIFAIERPSRPFAAKNQLVEKEKWCCQSYQAVPQKYQTQEIVIQAEYASRSAGSYDAEFIENYPNPFANKQAIHDLNRYLDLEQQYIANSDKNYWTEYEQQNITPEKYKKILLARKNLLTYFYKPTLIKK